VKIEIEQIVAIVLVVVAIGVPAACLLVGTIRLVLIGFNKGKA
jgi:hypothetical protein